MNILQNYEVYLLNDKMYITCFSSLINTTHVEVDYFSSILAILGFSKQCTTVLMHCSEVYSNELFQIVLKILYFVLF